MAIPSVQERVETTLQELRPYLEADGGDIRLVEITDDLVARIELMGACADCSMKRRASMDRPWHRARMPKPLYP